MERVSLQDRRERLTQLVPKVGPVAFARDRVLPVAPALQPLLPEAGLVRGSVIGCRGSTGVSLALAVVCEASAAGSWLACVGLATLGLRAASEVGIALERLVMVSAPVRGSRDTGEMDVGEADAGEMSWANMMSALIDGFDLIVLRGASAVRPGDVRRLQARLQARGAVLVVIGDPGPFICDITVTGLSSQWEGLGDGSGRLARRRLVLSATGRRSPRARQVEIWLPGAHGGIEPTTAVPTTAVPTTVATPAVFRQTG